MNCQTSKISEYVDCHLQPIVKEIPSYIQHTTLFLRKINQTDFVPDNSYLVSLDVNSLYTNIPNAEGIKSVKTSLENCSKWAASTKVITTFLALILTLSNFIFNCKNYLQIKGCTMGTICTPSNANIFMYHWERKFIHPIIKTVSLLFLRSRKFNIRRNNNKVDFIETIADLLPWSVLENCMYTTLFKLIMIKFYRHYLIYKYNFTCLLFWTKRKLTNDKKIF